jgi:hypothetical protein
MATEDKYKKRLGMDFQEVFFTNLKLQGKTHFAGSSG